MSLTPLQKCFTGLLLTLLSILTATHARAAVSKTCLNPLLEAIEKAEGNSKKPLTYVITAPVECQYFQVTDLDEETRSRIAAIVKEEGKVMSLDAKLSSVFGLLKLTAREPENKKIEPCEAYFFTLAQKRKKVTDQVDQTRDRKQCFDLLNAFLKEVKSLPTECDNPIEVTSRDFRDLYEELGRSYRSATQKVLPVRLAFGYAEIKNLTYKTLTGKCGRL